MNRSHFCSVWITIAWKVTSEVKNRARVKSPDQILAGTPTSQ